MINQKPFFAKPKQNVFQKKQKLFPQKKDRLRPFWTPKVQSRQQQNGSFAVSSIPASEPASIFKTNPRLCGACFPQTPSSCAFFSQHHPRAPFFFVAQHHLCFFHSTHLYFFHSIIVFFPSVKHPPLFFSQHHPRAQPRLRRVIAKTHPFLRLFLNGSGLRHVCLPIGPQFCPIDVCRCH